MIIYVNGDSHSAGAEAVNPYAFAEDDPLYYALGRQGHPDNIKASYGCEIANHYYAILHTDAESASSNDRIIRTTRQYLEEEGDKPDLIIIGWATWEREEWLHNGTYYQLTASGTDIVPPELHTQYKEWVIEKANTYAEDEIRNYSKIWQFHKELNELDIPHLFFNTYLPFGHVNNHSVDKRDWGKNYISPYDHAGTYYYWLEAQGYKRASETSYHYRADGHRAWAEFLIPHIDDIIR